MEIIRHNILLINLISYPDLTLSYSRGRSGYKITDTSALLPGCSLNLWSAACSKMASYVVENLSELNQLFRDISLKFSSTESEDVVQSLKKVYGQPFKSLGNQDLPSCLDRLHEFGYVSSSNLTLLDEFVANKSSNKHEIYKRIENFKASRSPRTKTKMELRGRSGDVKKTIEILKSKQNAVVNLYGSAGVGKTTLARNICDE